MIKIFREEREKERNKQYVDVSPVKNLYFQFRFSIKFMSLLVLISELYLNVWLKKKKKKRNKGKMLKEDKNLAQVFLLYCKMR